MGIHIYLKKQNKKWLLDTEKEVKVLEKELVKLLPRDTQENKINHYWKVSPNQLSEDLLEEVVLKEFHSSSTTTPEISLRDSWEVLLETLLLTLSMLRERLLLLWTLYMLLRDKEEPYTVSVHKQKLNSLIFCAIT